LRRFFLKAVPLFGHFHVQFIWHLMKSRNGLLTISTASIAQTK